MALYLSIQLLLWSMSSAGGDTALARPGAMLSPPLVGRGFSGVFRVRIGGCCFGFGGSGIVRGGAGA